MPPTKLSRTRRRQMPLAAAPDLPPNADSGCSGRWTAPVNGLTPAVIGTAPPSSNVV
jgi:hypothetical protein